MAACIFVPPFSILWPATILQPPVICRLARQLHEPPVLTFRIKLAIFRKLSQRAQSSLRSFSASQHQCQRSATPRRSVLITIRAANRTPETPQLPSTHANTLHSTSAFSSSSSLFLLQVPFSVTSVVTQRASRQLPSFQHQIHRHGARPPGCHVLRRMRQ